jgi:hypothetical protein
MHNLILIHFRKENFGQLEKNSVLTKSTIFLDIWFCMNCLELYFFKVIQKRIVIDLTLGIPMRSRSMHISQCCGSDPGYGNFLTPGSGIGFFRISDPKSIFLRAY